MFVYANYIFLFVKKIRFQEELDKVIATFQSTWSSAILDALSMSITSTASTTADLVPILYWPPRRRRRDPSIVRIVEMIGEGQVLYDKVTEYPIWCSSILK